MQGIATAWATDPGRVRRRNEDAALVLRWEVSGSAPVVLAAVADGMGGHDNGDAAAAITVRTMKLCSLMAAPPGKPGG